MTKILIILSILFIGIMMWQDYKSMQCPFPQFTVEEMKIICMEEGI